MKSIVKSILVIAFLLSAVPAQSYDSRQPLVTIRFDDPYVQYQNSLGMAVSQAIRVKQNVVFDIVAGSGAQGAARQVAADIASSGVSQSNITLSSSGYNNNEVMIFVR